MATAAVNAGYAVVAAANVQGSRGCWQTIDVPIVAKALAAWRKKYKKRLPAAGASLPLFLLGPSSGGFFATQYARQERGVSALSIQVSVPSARDVMQPLPSREQTFPPVQMLLMQRDSAKLAESEALLRLQPPWPGLAHAQVLRYKPKAVTPTFFSDGIVGLAPRASGAIRDALMQAGYVNSATSQVVSHPSRGKWREPVLGALSRFGRESLPQKSLQVAMDSIFARLDLAYAYHASSCELINATLAFFQQHAAAGGGAGGGLGVGRGGRGT